MDRQPKSELSPGDLKALRERERSTVSVTDDARIIQLLADRAGAPTRVHLVDGQVLEGLNVSWGYDLDDPYAHVSTNVSPSMDDDQSFPFEFFFTHSVSRISDPEDGLDPVQAGGSLTSRCNGRGFAAPLIGQGVIWQ